MISKAIWFRLQFENFGIIEKLAHAFYFQIARKTMLLLVNDIKEVLETRIHAIQLYYIVIDLFHFFL